MGGFAEYRTIVMMRKEKEDKGIPIFHRLVMCKCRTIPRWSTQKILEPMLSGQRRSPK